MSNSNILLIGICACSLIAHSGAAVIANYDFQSSDFTSSDVDANTTAGDLVAGIAGFDATNIGTTFQDGEAFETGTTSPALAVKYGAAGATLSQPRADLQEAIDNNRYLSFTIAPVVGQEITFTTLTLNLGKSSSGADINVSLLSDLSADPDFTSASDEIDATQTASGSNFTAPLSFDLSALTTVSSPTEFRLYFHTTASTGSHDFSIDDIVLNGDVTAIPEPSTAWLSSLAVMVLLRRRR